MLQVEPPEDFFPVGRSPIPCRIRTVLVMRCIRELEVEALRHVPLHLLEVNLHVIPNGHDEPCARQGAASAVHPCLSGFRGGQDSGNASQEPRRAERHRQRARQAAEPSGSALSKVVAWRSACASVRRYRSPGSRMNARRGYNPHSYQRGRFPITCNTVTDSHDDRLTIHLVPRLPVGVSCHGRCTPRMDETNHIVGCKWPLGRIAPPFYP